MTLNVVFRANRVHEIDVIFDGYLPIHFVLVSTTRLAKPHGLRVGRLQKHLMLMGASELLCAGRIEC